MNRLPKSKLKMRLFLEDSLKAQKSPLLYLKFPVIRIQVKRDQKPLNLYHHLIQMWFVTAVEREGTIRLNVQSTRKVIYRGTIALNVEREAILLRVVLIIIIDDAILYIVFGI